MKLENLSLIVSAAFLISVGQPRSFFSFPSQQSVPTYAETEDGFRSQLNDVVQSFRAGNTSGGHQLIEQFRLPDAAAWFSENFSPDQNSRLPERYDRALGKFSTALEKTVQDIAHNEDTALVANWKEGDPRIPERMHYKLTAVIPLKQQTLYRFHLAIQRNGKDIVSWGDTFIYRNGTFRFIGFGAWPIWSWEEGNEPGAPSGGYFIIRPLLIHQVPPIYPAAARKSHIEGTVVVKAIIDKEGRVARIVSVAGDPLLTDAASEAVRQWRYQPLTLGGTPVDVTATVVFKLNRR